MQVVQCTTPSGPLPSAGVDRHPVIRGVDRFLSLGSGYFRTLCVTFTLIWQTMRVLYPFQLPGKNKSVDLFTPKIKQGVCHTVALPFTLKSILRQKQNYGNSNISPGKNIIFKKSFKRNQNPSRYIITL
jgi:hypothetical protein